MENCSNSIEALYHFVYGEMGPERHREFITHLEVCPECQRNLLKIEEERAEILEALGPQEIDQELVQSIQANVLRKIASLRAGPRYPRAFRWILVGGLTASILIALGLYHLLLWQANKTSPFREIPIPWSSFLDRKTLADGSTLRHTPGTRYEVIGYRRIRLSQGGAMARCS
jgi:hypothetical protein